MTDHNVTSSDLCLYDSTGLGLPAAHQPFTTASRRWPTTYLAYAEYVHKAVVDEHELFGTDSEDAMNPDADPGVV